MMKLIRTFADGDRIRRTGSFVVLVALASCGSSGGTGVTKNPDAGGGHTPVDAAVDAPKEDAGHGAGHDAGTVVPTDAGQDAPIVVTPIDDCSASSGMLAWVASIPATSPTLILSDVVVGPTNDVIVADQSGTNYEQHRFSESGAVVSTHEDPIGTYVGKLWTSNLTVDAHNNLFYGMLRTGLPMGTSSQAQLIFTQLSPAGTVTFTDPTEGAAPTSDGDPTVLVFDTGFDSGGGLHGAYVMGASPANFGPGVYCYGSSGSFSGISAASPTNGLAATDFEWPSLDVGLYMSKVAAATTNIGCGSVTVPSGGGVVIAKLDGGGSCTWNKLLAIPTASIKGYNFRLGVDESLAVAVVYSGTIDLGGGSLTSTGTSSLAVAHYDSSGNLLFAKSFGAAGSSFTIGSLGVNASGTLVITAGYAGKVDLGGGDLPVTNDTLLASFTSTGTLNWSKTVTVGTKGSLKAAAGKCGFIVTTNSTSVDLGSGALSTEMAPNAASIGIAALGL
jgi:hypothetical protein